MQVCAAVQRLRQYQRLLRVRDALRTGVEVASSALMKSALRDRDDAMLVSRCHSIRGRVSMYACLCAAPDHLTQQPKVNRLRPGLCGGRPSADGVTSV
jgi:hypothetical protein